MANNFYIGGMPINKESITNRLSGFIVERKQDSSYINTYAFGAANISMPSKDTIIIKGKDVDGNETEKIYTATEVLNAIMNDINSRIKKYSVARDGYYRFCRADELKSEGTEIPPLDAHKVFYDMVVNEYNKRNDDQMKFLKDELVASGLTILPELFEDSEEVKKEKIKEIYEVVLRSDIAMVLYEIEASRRIFASRIGNSHRKEFVTYLNEFEKILEEEIIKYVDENEIDEHLYSQISIFSQISSGMSEFITETYSTPEGITDQDVIAMFENFLGKERIAHYVKSQPESIVERKQIVKYLTKKRICIRRTT